MGGNYPRKDLIMKKETKISTCEKGCDCTICRLNRLVFNTNSEFSGGLGLGSYSQAATESRIF